MIGKVLKWLSVSFYLAVFLGTACGTQFDICDLTLNGLEIHIDERTGSVVYLAYPATGVILKAHATSAGLLDLAYPLQTSSVMRLASRFSKARVIKESDGAMILWDVLGPSRSNIALPRGVVRAQVTLRAAADGRSIILQCQIQNHSAAAVRQILFPDLWGLKPFAGLEETRLRLARGVIEPFMVAFREPDSAPPYYQQIGWKQYPAGGYYSENALRWLDYGSFRGGLSVFQKKWTSPGRPTVLTFRSQRDPSSLRLVWEHKTTIQPGETWDSVEFWLTPHPGGWAKGIETFRDYVRTVDPPRRLPARIRDGLGFQTIWMTQEPEPDPARAYFRFKDLPRVAKDAREHGLDLLVPWDWDFVFRLPIPARPDLGTEEEFIKGVRQARQLGVDVAPFVSVHIIRNQDLGRYGVKPGHDDWSFNPELIPEFDPYYTDFGNGTFIPDDNKLWQKDVLGALMYWVNRGIPSLSWDQFIYKNTGRQEPALIRLIEKVRRAARSEDPEAVFGSESVDDLELDSRVLDFTWNWVDYVDAGPLLNVLRSPRLNCNVNDSPLVVKKCFIEGLYINAMPSGPDQPNGTSLISDHPPLAAALDEVAKLHNQFIPYFTDGNFIGDSILSEPVSAFVRGYQLRNKLLLIVLNDRPQPQRVIVQSDLGLWLSSTRSYEVSYYNSAGKRLSNQRLEGREWAGSTRLLQPQDLAIFEIQGHSGTELAPHR